MSEEKNPWQIRFERERKARKESEALLEKKSFELWEINQDLEKLVYERTESLKNAVLKAENADRAKSDFLANISHEIRTPLNAIIGFSDYLSRDESLSLQNNKYASIIKSSAKSLLTIINDILDFSKIQSGNFEISNSECNINQLYKDTIELFSQKMDEKGINFIHKIDKDLPKFIFIDGMRLKQVILNLLSNALKFTSSGKGIYFYINLIKKDEKNVSIEFIVKDEGIGIPIDKIETIFNPFIQVENLSNKQHVGTGLGLSICKNILKLFNSKFEINSEENIGTTFKFILDCEISNSIEEEIIENKSEEISLDTSLNGNILLAEDNSGNQELMKLVFEELDLNYKIAQNGLEALEIYKCDNSFDFVLMDINMPVMGGVESFEKIREYEKENSLTQIPIVALTANAIKGDEEYFLNLGMNDYLSKPINLDKLESIVKKYVKVSSSKIKNEDDIEKLIIDVELITSNLGLSESIVLKIVEKFKKDIFKDLTEFEKIIENGDYYLIKQKAHFIKNSCLNVHLDVLCNLLERIEREPLNIEQIKELYTKIDNLVKSLE